MMQRGSEDLHKSFPTIVKAWKLLSIAAKFSMLDVSEGSWLHLWGAFWRIISRIRVYFPPGSRDDQLPQYFSILVI